MSLLCFSNFFTIFSLCYLCLSIQHYRRHFHHSLFSSSFSLFIGNVYNWRDDIKKVYCQSISSTVNLKLSWINLFCWFNWEFIHRRRINIFPFKHIGYIGFCVCARNNNVCGMFRSRYVMEREPETKLENSWPMVVRIETYCFWFHPTPSLRHTWFILNSVFNLPVLLCRFSSERYYSMELSFMC